MTLSGKQDSIFLTSRPHIFLAAPNDLHVSGDRTLGLRKPEATTMQGKEKRDPSS
jgi:hypothetical protein